ncbi:MAG: AAA family ATPase [Myxococcota bacterium]|nr:AAA family ATPase [Myxococcota bacterium]
MPRLTKLEIANFRGIHKGEVSGFADVTVLVGRNNSGKSTVAEAIVRLAAGALVQMVGGNPEMDARAQQRVDPWSRMRGGAGGSGRPELWYRRDMTQPFRIAGKVGTTEFVVEQPKAPPADRLPFVVPQPGTAPERAFLEALAFFLPQDVNDAGIEMSAWPSILAHREDKFIAAAMQELFRPPVENVALLPDGSLMLLYPQIGISLQGHGEGVRYALRCLIRMNQLQGTMFVMEHPESHEHPGALERLGEAVCRQARQADVQLLVTTHSRECIRAFLEGSAKAGSTFAVLHLALTDGQLAVRGIDAETLRGVDRTGMDVRDLDLYA